MKMTSLIFVLLAVIVTSFAYDLGITNQYDYETSVLVSEACAVDKNNLTGYNINLKIELTAVWQDAQDSQKKLLKIHVSQPKLSILKGSDFKERNSDLKKISESDSFFLLNHNRIEKFWDNPTESLIIRNLKRSIASLLQVREKDGVEKVEDVSGKCDVLYKVEGQMVRRSKKSCSHPIEKGFLSQPFGVRSSTVQHSTGIDCDMKDGVNGIVNMCLAKEQVKTYSNLWMKASICLETTSVFVFTNKVESKQVYKNSDYKEVIQQITKKGELAETGVFALDNTKQDEAKTNVADSTTSFQDSLKTSKLAKLKSASAFFKLLPIFRSAAKDDLIKVLENKKFMAVLPQILDLLAASATRNSLDAALTFFAKTGDYDENLERFLISLSVIPSLEKFILTEIKSFLEKGGHHEKIESTLVTTLGALLRNYANSDKADSKVVEDVLEYLENSLNKCISEACMLMYLRGLRNAAQPKLVPLLLQYSLKGGKPSLEALLAIKNVQSLHLSTEDKKVLQKVYHQIGAKQDSSSRAVAAEILLKAGSEDNVLKSILKSLADQSDREFSTFLVSKVFRLMEEDQTLRTQILKILQDKDVAHYYSLSQKGKSSLFKRRLLSADGLNVTYGIEMELLEGGLLKRSSFDVDIETERSISNLLSVGMFSEGLESFAGESSSDESSSPLAGMELTLLGSSLRPYIFFSSTSELMGHAWSGTASEPTPALQGIFSLSDDGRAVVLHNGMVARLELRGAMSTDLSASIQISLWNRNSQSQVKNAAALLVKGSAVVDTEFAKMRGEYMYYGHSAIDFSTDSEFAETPFKMCLEMKQPDVVVKHDFQRSVELTGGKFSSKKTKKRKRFIPSRSYALHQNNNELCKIMKNSGYY